MRFARISRTATVVAAVAMTGALVSPTLAHAAPTTDAPSAEQTIPLPETTPDVDPATLSSLGAFAPALIGSIATRDDDGKVNEGLLAQAQSLADNPSLPPQAGQVWRSLIDFLGEPGKAKAVAAGAVPVAENDVAKKKSDSPNIPTGPRKPRIQQFLYPTIGLGCMAGGGNSVGMALTTAGPQAAPAPGPKRGQAGFVYTSLGTGPAKRGARGLVVTWLNLENGRTGRTVLTANPKINATKGPGTFTGIANTGRGRIVATVSGTVSTVQKGRTVTCGIAPTIGTAII
ncbi:hypothetical protein nbrc107696_41990 [Gordonia spumicola]|uniref:Secreted protein n=1 Tax=Gordonia spumicola TaxID=589161 RepID=A0A7I9VF71_9ACTN|nr:hypothetical protein [Gordonia spumicola]GEE03753.1 hypothetical protein nbrc107696_41990 [Gordonia spumicola]